MAEKILVVEDEPAIRESVSYALETEGFDVRTANDGAEAMDAAEIEDFDLVVLDLMLPKLSGTEVCRRMRATSAVPIVMLTAKNAELDVVLGLEVGADDYITKPFSLAELLGRVRALLRRRELDREELGTASRQVGGIELDLSRYALTVDGEPVAATRSEIKLLELLTREPERVFTREQIMRHLWDSDYIGDQRACDTHVSNLRAKVEQDAARPERIVTVRGVGYKLMPV